MDKIHPFFRDRIHAAVNGKVPWPLVLVGPPGIGKTRAALCLLDRAGGIYFTTGTLTDALMSAYRGDLRDLDGNPGSLAGLWRAVERTRLVVLDEVGTVVGDMARQAHYEGVKRLLDIREGRPLLLCSNIDQAALTKVYDDRVASRIAAGTVAELVAADRRLER